MTAPRSVAEAPRKPLPRGGRPYMTWKERGLHPSRRRFAPPQDEVSDPHGEERAFARVSNHEATTPSAKYFIGDNG
jgi:hypothetical protein